MIVCPVCEHAQAQGAECEVCGKRLVWGPAGIPVVPPVEGLEPTHHAAADVREEVAPDLESTRHAFAEAGALPAPDLDTGRAAPVDVDVQPVPELERTGDTIPGDAPTAVPAVVTCRYCRTPAVTGERVCGRCGMRLPVFESAPEDTTAAGRRCSCGLWVTGAVCPSCGARR